MPTDEDRALAPALRQDLHNLRVCATCTRELVQPILWRPTRTDGVWFVALRCPDCGATRHGFTDEAELERLEDAMNAGFDAMRRALDDLTGERMRADCERLIGAINAGAITPEDFAPRPT